jgi:hypothetical protein
MIILKNGKMLRKKQSKKKLSLQLFFAYYIVTPTSNIVNQVTTNQSFSKEALIR